MNISDLLTRQAAARGEAPGVLLPGHSLSYQALDGRVWQLAGHLRQCGVGSGDVLAHTFHDELTLWCCMLATARVGASVFSLPLNTPPLRRQQLLQQVGARYLVTDLADLHDSALPTLLLDSDASHWPAYPPDPGLREDNPSAPWIIVSGSGSTGRPKLLPVSHGQQWARVQAAQRLFPYTASDVLASLIPLDFYTSKMRCLEALAKGTPFVLCGSHPHGVLALIDRFKVTALYASVMHAEKWLQSLPANALAVAEPLNALMLIGSTVSDKLRQRIRARLCSRLYVLYGTNETGTLSCTDAHEADPVPGTVGRPQGDCRLEIVDAHDTAMPAGQPGQVRVRGPTVIDGYLGDALATARAFRGGWFYPGDLGRLTPDGQLIHLGRSDDMMIVNGINLYPAEIEQVLTAHPGVREAAAMPLRQAAQPDLPVCAVTLVEGERLDALTLLAYARARLGAWALHQVVVLEHIPRNDRGKPDRPALQAVITRQLAPLAQRAAPPARQMQRPITVAFDVPEHADLRRLDAWLAKALQIDLTALKGLAPPPAPVASAADHAWRWLSRCLLLAQALLLAARIPVFDTPQIQSITPMDDVGKGWQALVKLAQVDHLPQVAYQTALVAAFRQAAWASSHALNAANLTWFYTRLEDDTVKPLSHQLLAGKSSLPVLQAAHAKGVPFRHLGLGVFQLGWGAKAKLIDRSTTARDSAMGARLSQNKRVTGHLLRAAGLPAAVHILVATPEAARDAARRIGWPVVVKPLDRDRGEGVAVDVADDQALHTALNEALRHSRTHQALIERQVAGVCHRLFIQDGQLLYAVKRLPMSVTGTGRQTVAELVARECEAQQRLPPWMRSAIRPLDPLALATLAAQGWMASSIPGAGTRVPLRRIESTAWGGIDEDVSAQIHPENLRAAQAAAALFGLTVAGIDMISADISRPWYDNGAIINEVNFAPLLGGGELSRQHIPVFLERLLQGDGRISVEIFVGSDNAWLAAKARWQALRSVGVGAVLTNGRETFAASGEPWPMPFSGVYPRVHALTLSPKVTALLAVIPTDDYTRHGLPLEAVDAVTQVPDSPMLQCA